MLLLCERGAATGKRDPPPLPPISLFPLPSNRSRSYHLFFFYRARAAFRVRPIETTFASSFFLFFFLTAVAAHIQTPYHRQRLHFCCYCTQRDKRVCLEPVTHTHTHTHSLSLSLSLSPKRSGRCIIKPCGDGAQSLLVCFMGFFLCVSRNNN